MKKILLVGLNPSFGGGEVYLINLVKLLTQNNFMVFVICQNEQLRQKLEKFPIQLFHFQESFYKFFPLYFYRILKISKQHKIDYLHFNGERETFFTPFFLLFSKTLTSIRHTMPYTDHSLKSRFKNYFSIKCINWNKKNICVSHSLQNDLTQRGGNPQRLTVIHNAPESRFLQHVSSTNLESKFRLVMIARLDPVKGHQDLIQAVQPLKNIELYFVGVEDSELPSAKTLDFIKCLGPLDNVLPIIDFSDTVVLCSYTEGCPLVLLEGMAMGKPIIASDLPGIRELIEPNKQGILYTPGNIQALRSAIQYLQKNQATREEFGKNARKKVECYFSETQWQQKTLAFFTSL